MTDRNAFAVPSPDGGDLVYCTDYNGSVVKAG